MLFLAWKFKWDIFVWFSNIMLLSFPPSSLQDLQFSNEVWKERKRGGNGNGKRPYCFWYLWIRWFYNAMQYSIFLLLQGKKQRRIEEAGEKLSRYNIDMRVWRPSYRVSSLSQGDCFCFVVMSILLQYSHLWSQIGRGVPWIVSIHAIGGGHTTSGRTS